MNLKTIFISAALLLIDKMGFTQNKTVSIVGAISGIEKQSKAQLFQVINNKTDTLASVYVIDGRFTIKFNKNNEPGFYFLNFSGVKGTATLFLDSTGVQLTGTVGKWPNIIVYGSRSHKDYEVYHSMVDSLESHGQGLSAKLNKAQTLKDSVAATELTERLKRTIAMYEQKQTEFIKSHLDSYYSAVVIINAKWDWTKKREQFNKLSERIKRSSYGVMLNQIITNSKKQSGLLEIGDTIPDFVATTAKGKNMSIKESIKPNKLTLIDFWASWCAPCRQENPNLVETYKAHKNGGFDILGISLDEKASEWKNAILKDGLLWEHVSDLKGWKSPIATLYMSGMPFKFIPQNFLVNANGKILARNLRGEQLSKKIKECLNEVK